MKWRSWRSDRAFEGVVLLSSVFSGRQRRFGAFLLLPFGIFEGWKHLRALVLLPFGIFEGWKHLRALVLLPFGIFEGWKHLRAFLLLPFGIFEGWKHLRAFLLLPFGVFEGWKHLRALVLPSSVFSGRQRRFRALVRSLTQRLGQQARSFSFSCSASRVTHCQSQDADCRMVGTESVEMNDGGDGNIVDGKRITTLLWHWPWPENPRVCAPLSLKK